MEEFEKGLPNYGVGVKYYNVGSLLHPYYRGYTLKNIANSEEGREAAIKELVDNHPVPQSSSASHWLMIILR